MPKIRFANFKLDTDNFRLSRGDQEVTIGAKPLDVLMLLIENRHRVVSREELRAEIWESAKLSDATIPTCVHELRKALGDEAKNPEIIRSIRARGYRFISQISLVQDERQDSAGEIRLPLVGRAQQLRTIEQIGRGVRSGSGGKLVVIRGEPGSGKTRLLAEVAQRLDEHFDTMRAHSTPSEVMPGFWAWSQILSQAENSKRPLNERLASSLNQLRSIEERALIDPNSLPPGLTHPSRAEIFQAWTTAILSVRDTRPLAILIDDAQRLDRDSLLLLYWISEEIASTDALLVVSCRTYTASDETAGTISEMERLPHAKRISLPPLTAHDISELLDPLKHDVQELSRDLASRSNGNPFYLTHLLRLFHQFGRINFDENSHDSAPSNAREIVAQQLSEFESATRATLAAAAVLGESFEVSVLARIQERDARQTLRDLEPAIEAWILREEGPRLSFKHALLRESLYRTLSSSERCHLHLKAAAAITDSGLAKRNPALVAHHRFNALPFGRAEDVFQDALAAAEHASDRYAFQEAKHHFGRALDVAARVPGCSEETICRILISLGRSTLYCGDQETARAHLIEAAQLARECDSAVLLSVAALSLAPDFLSIEVGAQDPILVQLLEESLIRVGEEHKSLRAKLLARLSQALQWGEQEKTRVDLADEALAAAKRAGAIDSLVSALAAKAETENGPRLAPSRLETARQLGHAARQAGDRPAVLLHHTRMISAYLDLGDIDGVRAENQKHRALSEELGLPQYRWLGLAIDAMLLTLEGRISEAEKLGERYMRIARPSIDQNATQTFAGQRTTWLIERDQASLALNEIRSIAESRRNVRFWRAILAWIALEARETDLSRRLLDRFIGSELSVLLREVGGGVGFALLCDVAAELGSDEQRRLMARESIRLTKRCATAGYGVAYFGSFELYTGRLLRSLGNYSEAITALSIAFENEVQRNASSWAMYALAELVLAERSSGEANDYHEKSARRFLGSACERDQRRAYRILGAAISQDATQ